MAQARKELLEDEAKRNMQEKQATITLNEVKCEGKECDKKKEEISS